MATSIETRIHSLEQGQHDMSSDILRLQSAMDANTAALREYIDLSKKLKIGLSFLGGLERAAVWITKVALATATLWGIWKFIVLQTITEAFKK